MQLQRQIPRSQRSRHHFDPISDRQQSNFSTNIDDTHTGGRAALLLPTEEDVAVLLENFDPVMVTSASLTQTAPPCELQQHGHFSSCVNSCAFPSFEASLAVSATTVPQAVAKHG